MKGRRAAWMDPAWQQTLLWCWSEHIRHELFYMVEATAYEELALWQENHERVCWKQVSQGFWRQIGTFAGRPVCVSVSFAHIGGELVGFYEATSQVVDYEMVRDWIKLWSKGVDHTNAMNFGHVLGKLSRKRMAAS